MADRIKPDPRFPFERYIYGAVILWTLVVVCSCGWNIYLTRIEIFGMARE